MKHPYTITSFCLALLLSTSLHVRAQVCPSSASLATPYNSNNGLKGIMFDVTERSIDELRSALESGETTAVELVRAYVARIDAYDAPGTATELNAVVVRNPDAIGEAQASDARRAAGQTRGPLDGIPYTAKDSYLADRGGQQPGRPTPVPDRNWPGPASPTP